MVKKNLFITIILFLLVFSSCKKDDSTIESFVGFEELELNNTGIWNGSGGEGKFVSGYATFINNYNTQYKSWTGFAYSNKNDNTIAGFLNQYSTYADKGAENSEKFAIGYNNSEIHFSETQKMESAYFTNMAYPALSMKAGDQFAKKFGGATGNDKDWFLLTVEGIDKSDNSTGKVQIYLADYRFDDNSQDFIQKEWKLVDLSALGEPIKLKFSLSSSDVGSYGMNTPSYFCIDNIKSTVK